MFTQIVKDPNAGIGVLKIASLSFKKAATPAALSFLINMQHGLSHNTKKAPKIGAFKSAADRNRTGTGITTHGILSPGRLPVPPLRLIYMCTALIRTIRASTVSLANYHTYKRRKNIFSYGWRWIRTTEAICSRFTVCPLWPLGNPSKSVSTFQALTR